MAFSGIDSLGDRWRSFWHTMTSYDRHATPDSPYRTGRHVPLHGGRHAPLTSIATSGLESRPDLTYAEDGVPGSATSLHNGLSPAPYTGHSPTSPYAPGMRSSSAADRNRSTTNGPGEIQLQSFQDGLPPPPPVSHSWKRIDRWAEDQYAELYDQLAEGATHNDLNELEYMLDCSLPLDVRESWQIHDGQERGGMPTGIIFGCMLLDCEEMVQEWQQWRKVNQEFLSDHVRIKSPHIAKPPVAGPSSAATAGPASNPAPASTTHAANPLWRQELLAKQDSQPSNAVRKAYAHPGWIPLARDWGGNNIAVDLAPGPAGTWGQIIIFGRDFDCKYVVARSWAAFLAMVADDLGGEKWFVDEETGELKLREFASQSAELSYVDILKRRMDLKYGKKSAKRKPGPTALKVVSGSGSGMDGPSPRASPVGTEFERGRSMHRFSGPAAMSPKSRPGRSSPLAKVAEEAPAAVTTHTGTGSGGVEERRPSKLIDAPTPAPRFESDAEKTGSVSPPGEEAGANGAVKGLGVNGINGSADEKSDPELKTVEL
ncbi:MAG: 1,2-dihydroxy-3-keto-5-methylthiopentene dioxygenase [Watsoniomyces obsoletus]|nr:MAG: 1,2-dihydroxy-3-keto-5-methylthiopentene dioxygenase [Watsoniomyces obsoletus]